jgi:hypothetical protein
MSPTSHNPDDPGLAYLLVRDGRPLLSLSALVLLFAGLFALFVAMRGEFLPHDIAFLGMTPAELCAVHECRIVHFMIHDRVSFGGALVAIAVVYLWLVAGPMGRGERWSWDVLCGSGLVGFVSFLAYLGYGCLDTWHGVATVTLAPLFIAGLLLTHRRIGWLVTDRSWFARPPWLASCSDLHCLGRVLLLVTAGGMIAGGLTITGVGMTTVFVSEDLMFMGVVRADLDVLNPRLVPLIAHDRAGFGGAVCCCGGALAGVIWRAKLTRSARQALLIAGLSGFGTAVFVHPAIGYNDAWHLSPAVAGAILFAIGLCLVGCRQEASLSPPIAHLIQ